MVSIVIPVYNVENFLEKCIYSVMAQTYSNLEIILVDDGSPDNCPQICDLFKERDNRIKVIHKENGGLASARNAGMNIAVGDWIYFLDSDDMILPCTIEHMINAGADSDVDLVFSSFKSISSSNVELNDCNNGLKKVYSREELQKIFLLRKVVVLAPGTLYKRSFLINNDLKYKKIPWSEDQHFVWRVLALLNKAIYLDEPLYLYYRREGSIMTATKTEKIAESYKSICELQSYYKDSYIGKFLVSRWVMGSLNAAAILTDFNGWKELYKQIDGHKHLKRLVLFKDIKVKVLALVGFILPKLYYSIIKRVHSK